jgi:hypothetical protein
MVDAGIPIRQAGTQELSRLEVPNVQSMLNFYCRQWPRSCDQPQEDESEIFPIFAA